MTGRDEPHGQLMACVGPGPRAEQIVRAASVRAARLGAPWFAVHVETEASSVAERDGAAHHLLLAERLGARAVTLTGRDVAAELLAFALANDVGLVLVGRGSRGDGRRSPVRRIVRGAGGIDVLVVDAAPPGAGPPVRPTPRARGRRDDRRAGYLWATAIVLACTVLTVLAAPYIGLVNADAIYLLAVVAVAARFGRGPAILTSLLGLLAFDFFVVPPPFGFVPEDAAYVVTLVVTLAVALTVSALAARLRQEVDLSRQRFARMATMYDFAADLARAVDGAAVAGVVARHLRRVYGCASAVLAPDAGGDLRPVGREAPLDLTDRDRRAAAAALATGAVTGGHGDDALHLPLRAGTATVGVLCLLDPAGRFEIERERLHLEAFANQTALALERADLALAAQRAELDAEQERMRNMLLRSVGHDLRTPLAAIQGAASTLQQSDALEAGTRRELLQSIHQSCGRLGRQIHNILEITRLEAGAVRPSLEWTPLDEVVGAALTALDERLGDRQLRIDLPDDLPPLPLDGLLAQQVVVNLVDNALRHTPAGSPIDLVARRDGTHVVLEISDRGPGIPATEHEKVFEKFHRHDGDASTTGTGLGLAIARTIMGLLHGRVWMESREGGGATFRVAFPCSSPALPEPAADPPEVAT